MSTPQKPLKKVQTRQKVAQKVAKPMKAAPKAKAPPAGGQGQQPADQD